MKLDEQQKTKMRYFQCLVCDDQGRNERGGKGMHNALGAESLVGPENLNNVAINYFLQYSTFTPKRPWVITRGRQICFLPLAPSNLGMSPGGVVIF